jgi:hypothetical protein
MFDSLSELDSFIRVDQSGLNGPDPNGKKHVSDQASSLLYIYNCS